MDSIKRARLGWRCRRGMRELDVLLMRYMDRDYERADAAEQAAFETLLDFQDPEILDLLTGRLTAQDVRLQDVVERLLSND
ncbi:MAG: succinate dehydrogenase assembly factor 2 [Gammaproteobacteria bacterium]|nr:MAG: succinate dehydrogenase assembly factor 2 [Gammaproteobacteria bacterium]